MSEKEEISMQKVGMRDDKEKKAYEPYTSRERHYEQQYQSRNGIKFRRVHTMNVLKSTQL